MSKQQVEMSKRQIGQARGRAPAGTFAAFGLTVLISAVFAWLTLHYAGIQEIHWVSAAGLFLAALVLVVLFENSLAHLSIRRAPRCRLAFLGSLLFFSLLLILFAAPGTWLSLGGKLLLVFTGAFSGGLVATRAALWENNSPPTQQVQVEVLQRHRLRIGTDHPIRHTKRAFDVALAFTGMLASFPVWLLVSFLVWIEDPGPLLFVKNSVGKGGGNFHQFKFRTMVQEAELTTGPVLSGESDERVLMIGRLLRKTALDELPQLINILKGEMSFVGPRPQRTVLVNAYLQQIPEYADRHSVHPGLAGLAQVAGDYFLTPRQKLRYDRLYIRYSSLGFDLKLIFLAFMVAFWYRWQADWNGRLPRHWLHRSRG
jgi:lipopolysaccharide/colanic/teichoic acid biosynthesis glycosyltransferase